MLRGGGGGKPLAGPLVEVLAGRGKVEAPPQLGCCKDDMAKSSESNTGEYLNTQVLFLAQFCWKKEKALFKIYFLSASIRAEICRDRSD